MKLAVKLVREIIGMCFIFAAGAYQEHNWVVAHHVTVGDYMIASVILILGRVIFG